MKATTCPSRDDLSAYLLGKLPEDALKLVAEHSSSCSHCQQLLQALDSSADPLIQQVRLGRASTPAPQLAALLNKAEAIPVQAGINTVTPGNTLGPGAGVTQDVRKVLAPPQGPGEIGRLGRYRVLRLLGQGGMGMVFQAEDTQLERAVALKVMLPSVAANPAARERFLREARATAAIEHDHIVTIFQVDDDGDVPYLAMQMLKGMSLEDYLKKAQETNKPLTLGQILKLGREIARGLAAAHERKLIHRDIKPANIWLDATAAGRVKILDFGLARPAAADSHITQSGMIVGTPAYMAPEQATGQKIDGRADLFSLGCVLFRLCSGRLPWKGNDAMGTLIAIATEDPPNLADLCPNLPAALTGLVMKLLSKEPANRPQSARVVADTIQAIERELAAVQAKQRIPEAAPVAAAGPNVCQALQEESVTAPMVKPSAARKPSRRPLVILGSLVAAVVLLLAAAVIYVQTDQGTLKIETADDDVQVVVEQGGKVVKTIDKKSGKELVLHSGEYRLKLGEDRPDLVLSKNSIQMKRGQTVVVTISKVQAIAAAPRQRTIKTIAASDKPITQDGVTAEQGGWKIESSAARTVRLFEVPKPGVENGMVTYRAQMKAEKLEGKAYLEMWCRVPGLGEFFSKGLANPVQGTTAWASYEIPFRLEKGQSPDLIKLNVVVEGKGTLWIKDIEVLFTPFAPEPGVGQGRGVTPEWIAAVQKLSADKQVEAVAAKLKELNPGFEGKVMPVFDKDGVVEVRFATDKVSDISPVRALYRLQRLVCQGSRTEKGGVADLSPLVGMQLRLLNCKYNQITDLSPLKDLPLTHVYVGHNAISDLSPLAALPLEKVGCEGTAVSDLSPLKGKRLITFNCAQTPVRDLAPLRGMPLTELQCWGTAVSDLSPLQGMPLEDLSCEFISARDAPFLRAMQTLKRIKSLPAAEFWKQWDAKHGAFEQWVKDTRQLPLQKQVDAVLAKLKELNPGFDGRAEKVFIGDTIVAGIVLDARHLTNIAPVRGLSGLAVLQCTGTATDRAAFSDLSPLAGLRLQTLNVSYTQVADLGPLRGMNTLTRLYCDRTRISDLSPLAGLKLEQFHFFGPWFDDISLLKDMPLESVNCSRPEAHRAVLLAIPTLKTINGKPRVEVLGPTPAEAAFEQWIKDVQQLPPEKQLAELSRKLRELNPKFVHPITPRVEDGKVTEVQFIIDDVTDISPLRALPELRRLSLRGSEPGKGKLADLSPLRGVRLTSLTCDRNQVADLSPLTGMPLRVLEASFTPVADLAPLKGMPLVRLVVHNTQVRDLSPLAGMGLEQLHFSTTKVADLSPVRGMPLRMLWCDFTPVTDLSPIQGMPLKELWCPFKPERDAEILRSIKTLETINGKPAAEFWKQDVKLPPQKP